MEKNTKSTKLIEGVGDALQYLKKLRSRYDTENAKQFFNEINLIDDKSENGLNTALDIFKKFYNDKINISEEYAQEVLKYSKVIYKQFYENYILNLSLENIATTELIKPYQRDSFLYACSFLYSALLMNDKKKMMLSYQKCMKVIESFETPTWTTIIASILTYILFIIGYVITFNSEFVVAGVIILIINTFYVLYYSIRNYFTRKRARVTGDIS